LAFVAAPARGEAGACALRHQARYMLRVSSRRPRAFAAMQLLATVPAVGAARCLSGSASGTDLAASIKETIAASKVTIFSKSTCPFCRKTKSLFDGLGQEYTAIELNELENGPQLQATLLELTGQRTVPNVFVNGKHLGGNDDTHRAAASGTLAELLK
jgi:glutaredoxin 3